jgi:transcriptional regulator with XRE-family HTH domain
MNAAKERAEVKDDLAKRIGVRLHGRRKEARLTLAQLMEMTALSQTLLSRIENGRVMPSIQTLQVIANALNVNIDYFFRKEEEREYVISRAGRREVLLSDIGDHGGPAHEIQPLADGFEGALMEPVLITVWAKEDSADIELTTHDGQEFMFILDGTLSFSLGSKKYVLRKGDSVYWNGTIPHGGRSMGAKAARTLNVLFMPGKRASAFRRKSASSNVIGGTPVKPRGSAAR